MLRFCVYFAKMPLILRSRICIAMTPGVDRLIDSKSTRPHSHKHTHRDTSKHYTHTDITHKHTQTPKHYTHTHTLTHPHTHTHGRIDGLIVCTFFLRYDRGFDSWRYTNRSNRRAAHPSCGGWQLIPGCAAHSDIHTKRYENIRAKTRISSQQNSNRT